MNISLIEMPRGNEAVTEFTAPYIYNTARNGSFCPSVIKQSRNIINQAKANVYDHKEKADCLFRWIKKECQFFPDPSDFELIKSPRIFINDKFGDCDDFLCALLSLNMACGNKGRVIAVSTKNNGRYNHVYLEIITKQGWISYDPVFPLSYPNWRPRHYSIFIYAGSNSSAVYVDGFFDSLFDEVKRFAKRIEKNVIRRPLRELKRVGAKLVPEPIYEELKRFESSVRNEVKRVARNIKEELERFSERVNKEFERWQEKLGPFSQFLVVGLKSTIALSTGGLIVHAILDSPFALTEDEWTFFIQLGLTIASAIVTFVTAGAAGGLLATSIMQLANTTISAVKLKEALDARRDAISELKKFKAIHDVEIRLKRESIRELEKQIIMIERIKQRKEEYQKRIELIMVEHELKVNQIMSAA